ncbi:probable methyltransferase-like protein 15 homolog [Episyrphus balteatus]|uniref:probable methyltransferase-like protein 15 homolog n=1 Tax=Episyrphus balteatus TaxID=286459 RepID=UPI00248503BE|nr:probable methyltransferase-like protein 15 homolog [Episyrphus balteatus]
MLTRNKLLLKKSNLNILTKLFLPYSNAAATDNRPHIPVLFEETINYLDAGPSKVFIDMTFGAGGHSRGILQKAPDATIYALDRDPIAHEHSKQLAAEYPAGQIIPLLGKFSDLPQLLKERNVKQGTFDGIVFDLGVSSMQFDESERGFSHSKNAFLDMRMGHEQITAAEFLAKIDEPDLAKILRVYGGEKAAKRIARTIVESRSTIGKTETTKQLADLVASSVSQTYRVNKLQRRSHVATLTFQAIRIFLNNELNEINYGMILAQRYLKKGGRLVIITFHSLEDTIVKRHINGNIIEGMANPVPLKYSGHDMVHDQDVMESLAEKTWKQLHKHVIVSSEKEVSENARSRSAKLRAVEKIN